MSNYLSVEKRKQIFHLLCEGNGIRSIGRVVGCSNRTVASLQRRYYGIVNFINNRHINNLDVEEIEADEIRTFVRNKTNLKWVYIALDRESRMVLHFHVGKRDTKDAKKFLIGLSGKLNSVSKVSTDCLKSYVSAVEKNPENYTPLSETEAIDLLRSKHLGRKLGRTITNRVETHNGNVRQHVSRLVRRTRCFSKKEDELVRHLTLFFFYYNFIKVHQTLKTAPCVAAGILASEFRFDELLEYDLMMTGQNTKVVVSKEIIPTNGHDHLNGYEEKIAKLEAENARLLAGEISNIPRKMKDMEPKSAAAALGRIGGLRGGIARAEKLSPERRREIARQGAEARWGKRLN